MSTDLLPRPAPSPAAPPGPADPPTPARQPGPSSTSRRVWRNRMVLLLVLAVIGTVIGLAVSGGGGHPVAAPVHRTGTTHPRPQPNPRLFPDWQGDGKPIVLAFGGDVNFPVSTTLGDRLADDPADALGPTVPELLGGADLSMVNFESSLTDGTCPDSQDKEFVFYAPPSAVTAFRGAGITLVTEANNHGEDCGAAGLQMALTTKQQTGYPILGIGQDEDQAFTPYETTIKGQKIVVLAATQVIDSDLQSAWTATPTQPGLASAYDVDTLVAAVEAARRVADTVVVYLHWGTQLDACPNALQEPLATLLVKAGADVVVGTHAHVLLGGGYLGSAYVDYGLGNFAFYDNSPPENASGSLVVTVTGRHVDGVTWRPAVIEDDLPQPLSGQAADAAVGSWDQERSCTDATATPGASEATPSSETSLPPASEVQPLTVDSG